MGLKPMSNINLEKPAAMSSLRIGNHVFGLRFVIFVC